MVENSHTMLFRHGETKFSIHPHQKRDRVLLKDITNEVEDPSWQLCKREQFAISLRKEKKKLILSKKRANLALAKPQVNIGDCFADLHPAFSDRFTTVVSYTLPHFPVYNTRLFLTGGQKQALDADTPLGDADMALDEESEPCSTKICCLHKQNAWLPHLTGCSEPILP